MAEEHKEQGLSVEEGEGEVRDRGLFDFGRKKEETAEKKAQGEEEVLVSGVEKIRIEEGHKVEEEEKKLHRSHSTSSSSSSDEEEEVEGEGGIKQKIKKKKAALKEKIEEKLHGGNKKDGEEELPPPPPPPPPAVEETSVVVEKVDTLEEDASPHEGEKKGFLEKIKEKLPGHGKKAAEEGGVVPPSIAPPQAEVTTGHVKEHETGEGTEGKEKKGFLGKIIEKLPGYHKSAGEEGEKTPTGH